MLVGSLVAPFCAMVRRNETYAQMQVKVATFACAFVRGIGARESRSLSLSLDFLPFLRGAHR